jgi:flagellar hook protein FlgE
MWMNTAITGINAASSDLTTISNNIANSSTVGFKQSRTEFADMYAWAGYGMSGNVVGNGVYVQNVAQQFTQGSLNSTGNVLDLAISGDGFFTVNDGGKMMYTRAGSFGTDAGGYIVNSMGQRLQVYPPVQGSASFNTGTLSDVQLSSATNPPRATTETTVDVNLPSDAEPPANAAFDPTDPESFNETTSMTVYDSLGAPHTQSTYYVKDATSNSWTVHVTMDGTEVGTGTQITFDESGKLVTPADGQLAISGYDPGNGAAVMNMTMDVSEVSQYGEDFTVSSLSQDGYTAGQIWGIEVTQDGVIQARYTNGQLTPLGQIAMATFPNTQGLQQLGSTSWAETSDSGQPLMGTGNNGNFGSVQSGYLEASNVDLTQQLVSMMTAQRDFQANSQVISTSDELMQTIINLR